MRAIYILSSTSVILTGLVLFLLTAFGCAPALQASPDAGVYVPPALVSYSPEFAAKLAQELRGAPPELATFAVDYIKLRCTIKPEMRVCTDLLK